MPNKKQDDNDYWKEKRADRPNAPKRRHGRRPECLPTEDADEYTAIETEFYASLNPVFPEERSFVDDIVYNIWMLRRLDRTEVELFTYVHENAGRTHPDFPLGQPLAEKPKAFNALMWRYISIRKALKEAFAGFRDLRENPFPLPPPPPPPPAVTEIIQTPSPEIGFEFSTHPAPQPDTLSTDPMSKAKAESVDARRWHISGLVQGVGYRNFAQRSAVELGLTGYAMNLPVGSVEVYAVGPPSQLSVFAGLLHKGPRWSDVRAIDENQDSVTEYATFEIR
jgi:acylphosphatase